MSILFISLSIFTACEDYDDDINSLKDKQKEHEERIKALEDWSKTVNNNISALQTILNSLENKDYVTGIVPVMESGKEIGYTISFTISAPITIFHGQKGETGEKGDNGLTPVIGATQDDDGIYYWTQKFGDDEPQFILDANGNKIKSTGDPGKSAYQIAVENGYTGNESQWLASLNGKSGVNGKSAYELAVENGYKGTISQWLDSLKGVPGINGKSAYDLAVEKGYTGTEKQWLASLNGKNGVTGKSAYELAVENGYTGSETDWLASLKGKTGTNGITPQIRINQQTNEWETSVDDGNTWATTGINATGPKGEQGPAGSDSGIFAENGIDISNSRYITFTLADGETKIYLPRYQEIEIEFEDIDNWGAFAPGETRTLKYKSTGVYEIEQMIITNIPRGWNINQNTATNRINITSPASFEFSTIGGDLVIIVGGKGFSHSQILPLGPKVKSQISENGQVAGVIIREKDTKVPGLIINASEPGNLMIFSTENELLGIPHEINFSDGKANTILFFEYINQKGDPSFWDTYPIFNYIKTEYGDNPEWYLPSTGEMKLLYTVFNDGDSSIPNTAARTEFNNMLIDPIVENFYMTSSEDSNSKCTHHIFNMSLGSDNLNRKETPRRVRTMRQF